MKTFGLTAVLVGAALLSGCAAAPFQPGLLFSQQKIPVVAPNQATTCAKTGTGQATNILGLFAFGDASIATAKSSAGISKVDSVDISHTGILGLYSSTTIQVCGE
ncbi:TRL-like family protein [Solimonas sp. SE-A11]|uniref:TRL-like family protein n=1 Tax=Solimonas sp. SE-A11 TaxID=3054954 RepID=UPI00259D19C6|nr:TRL-like family protein [Solimonas sp. SE-A11]MDM4769600.1 TRL-like family protein [Solimonas sp. SE-A11]